MPIQEIARPR